MKHPRLEEAVVVPAADEVVADEVVLEEGVAEEATLKSLNTD